ncbi:NmrA-like family protein [Colletotrichum tabaci]|uniref:NmrA-like family protein n=1 Tax=Colletotrichum tabaci TaxID=1209068 RepID=A0AAV9TN50_9PEZI
MFAVTDFWSAIQNEQVTYAVRDEGVDVAVAARQLEESWSWGRNLAVAAAGIPTLERFVFSSLPHVSELSQGRVKHVHHFDRKANVVKHIRQTHPTLWTKMSQIMVGFYNSNILPGSYIGPEVNQTTKKAEFEGLVSNDFLIPFIGAPVSTGLFVRELLLAEPVEGISHDASQSQCQGPNS